MENVDVFVDGLNQGNNESRATIFGIFSFGLVYAKILKLNRLETTL